MLFFSSLYIPLCLLSINSVIPTDYPWQVAPL
jgi:hypothetical protein